MTTNQSWPVPGMSQSCAGLASKGSAMILTATYHGRQTTVAAAAEAESAQFIHIPRKLVR